MTEHELTAADVAYISRDYVTLDELCAAREESPAEVRRLIAGGRLPARSYVLPDGTEMFPPDYFVFVDQAGGPERLREEFERRYAQAGGEQAERDEAWSDYMDGIFGVCLRHVLPETIARKGELVASIARLLNEPDAGDAWAARLRRDVAELDALEREFSPDFDRGPHFDRSPSRDLLIHGARERFPDVFATEVTAGGR